MEQGRRGGADGDVVLKEIPCDSHMPSSPALARRLALALTMIWTTPVRATHETPWPRVPMHQNSLGSVYNTLVPRLHPQTVTWHGTLALGISSSLGDDATAGTALKLCD